MWQENYFVIIQQKKKIIRYLSYINMYKYKLEYK